MAAERSKAGVALRGPGAGLCAVATAAALFVGDPGYAQAQQAHPVAAQSAPVKYIIVPRSRNQDDVTLFTIAQATLGDGDRFTEIFALNKGKRLPDGTRFEQPEQLDAGFVLRLPPDASGPGVQFGPLPASPVDTQSPTPPPRSTSAAATTRLSPPTSVPDSAAVPKPQLLAPRPVAATSTTVSILTAAALLALLLLLALGGFLLRRARRAASLVPPVPSLPPVPAPRAAEPSTADIPTPPSLFNTTANLDVSFEDLALQAHFSGFVDAEGPPPIVWLRRPHLVPRDGSYIGLGSSDPGYLFLDLAQAPGIISVTGRPAAVARVADAIIRQAGALAAPHRPQLVLVGAAADRNPDAPHAYLCADPEECATGVEPIVAGARFQLVVCDPLDASTLARLYATAIVPCVVLITGDQPGAAWTITARGLEPPPSWQRRPPTTAGSAYREDP